MTVNEVEFVLPNQYHCFFQKCSNFFFLTLSLIDRCQIVTDTCKKYVSKFVWKPFKSPLSLQKFICFGEASPLYHLFALKLSNLWTPRIML